MSRFTTTARTRASSARSSCAQCASRGSRSRNGWTLLRARIDVSKGTATLACLLLLAACGTYGPGKLAPGQSEADARAELGEPTTRTVLPDGRTRLDYARGPYGKHTWRVELDSSGKVAAVSQLLTEPNFEALRPGWSQEQVRDHLGPPSETRGGWRGLGEVWSYRYDWHNLCRWFQVWLVDGKVYESSYAPDPDCEARPRLLGL